MVTDEDDIRRILRASDEPLWASDVTERLNTILGVVAFTVDRVAARLVGMEDVESLPDGRWKLK